MSETRERKQKKLRDGASRGGHEGAKKREREKKGGTAAVGKSEREKRGPDERRGEE